MAEPLAARASGRADAASRLGERRSRLDPRGPEGRRYSEHDSRQERHREREDRGAVIEVDLAQPRHVGRGERDESLDAGVRDEKAEDAADQPEEDTLGQELPRETATIRAQGPTDRDLPLPFGGPGQHEVRDVGARDEKQANDGAHQDPESAAAARADHLLDEGNRVSPPLGVRLGVLGLEPIAEDLEIGPNLADRDVGAQSAHQPEVVHAPVFQQFLAHKG